MKYDIIDEFVDPINGFVCIRIVNRHSFYAMVPVFSTLYFVFSRAGNIFCLLVVNTWSKFM